MNRTHYSRYQVIRAPRTNRTASNIGFMLMIPAAALAGPFLALLTFGFAG